MLKLYRDEQPVPGRMVQFSGGEPTVHPEFLEIVAAARDYGFSHIQIASNGIKLADYEFAERAAEAGLHTVVPAIRRVDDEVYLQNPRPRTDGIQAAHGGKHAQAGPQDSLRADNRGRRERGPDRQILQFAIDNIDVSSGISYQPVSITGRISREERERMRFTLPDLAREIEAQTGICNKDDWLSDQFLHPDLQDYKRGARL